MSVSPPIRRLSTSSSRQEELINAYEAEEERIINLLSRKLEKLREEKVELENTLEAESESHVNRLSRELTALRLAQQQQQQQQQQLHQQQQEFQQGSSTGNGMMSVSVSPETKLGIRPFMSPPEPTFELMLDALRRENEQLRHRLVTTEKNYIRLRRLNETYREELIRHRRRLSLPIDNLIGLSDDALSQSTHSRTGSLSSASSPTSMIYHPNPVSPRAPTNGVPIPRPSSQMHRPVRPSISEVATPLSHSPSSTESPFPFSPAASTNPASYISTNTHITSPSSGESSLGHNFLAFAAPDQNLTYPSVPPPSVASSIGSPTTSFLHREPSHSPVEPLSRGNSISRRRGSTSHGSTSRRRSVERGGRIAETGVLLPRSRADSHSLLSTTDGPSVSRVNGFAIPRMGFFDSDLWES